MTLATIVAVTQIGCACTEIGWQEGLTIWVRLDSGDSLPPGDYAVVVDADGEEIRGAFVVDSELEAHCSDPEKQCITELELGGDRRLRLQLLPSQSYGGGVQELTVVLTYLDDGLDGGPARAAVRVERDGAIIGDEVFEPAYTRDEINGPGCGVATQAQAEMVLAL